MSKTVKSMFLPNILTAIAFITLIALGAWQVYRFNYKDALLTKILERINEDRVYDYSPLDEDMEYKKYSLSGTFLYPKTMLLYGQNPSNTKQSGYFAMTPFVVDNHNDVILINRGWVESHDVAIAFSSKATSSVIRAIAVGTPPQNSWAHKNNIKNNLWFSINLHEMSDFVRHNLRKDVYMLLLEGEVNDNKECMTPHKIDNLHKNITNHHMMYAVIWFALALALAIMYTYRKTHHE